MSTTMLIVEDAKTYKAHCGDMWALDRAMTAVHGSQYLTLFEEAHNAFSIAPENDGYLYTIPKASRDKENVDPITTRLLERLRKYGFVIQSKPTQYKASKSRNKPKEEDDVPVASKDEDPPTTSD